MKLRTVLISVVVSAALIGGAGYGAYYATQSQKSPIEVVPVANVRGYSWMDERQTIYGSVTSQVAQTVQLNEEYGIDKIYVEVGDEVKEGTPLFSYDMTLQELELEMQQLELQTNELTLTRLEKELEKLKKTPATAALERDFLTMTASAEESMESGESEKIEESEELKEPDDSDEPDEVVPDETEDPEPAPDSDGADTDRQAADGQDGVAVDDVENVGGSKEGSELSTVENSVLSFEALVLELQMTFLTCGDDLKASDVGEAIEQAVLYYRRNLADEKKTEEEQEDGSVREVCSHVLKDSVKAALDKEETETLRKRCRTLEEYQVAYVEMLIAEAQELEASALSEAVSQIGEAYELLDTAQRDSVENIDRLEELKTLAEAAQGQDGANEAGETSGTDETDGAAETDGSAESGQPQDGDSQTDADQSADGVRRNTVTFDVSDGAAATVNGEDVTNSIAMAENGRIVFGLSLEDGYELTEVLVDGSIPARKNEESDDPDDYIIEGIQTNETIVSVRTQLDPDVEPQSGDVASAIAEDEAAGGAANISEPAGADGTGDGATNGDGQNGETGGDAQNGETGGDGQNDETGGNGTGSGDTGEGSTNGEGSGGSTAEDSQSGEPTKGKEFTVTINPGNRTEKHEVGRLVPLQADLSDVTLVFMGWSVVPTTAASGEGGQASAPTADGNGQTGTPTAGNDARTVELTSEDVAGGYASFTMPEFDVTATAKYENAPDAIESYVTTFLAEAEKLLAENAAQTYSDQGKDFLTELESAIVFYQQWLSNPMEEILEESETTAPDMEKYQLLGNVSDYLTAHGKEFQVKQLKERYRELCLLYAKSLFEAINPAAIDKDLLEKALDTYEQLGENWRKKLENRWKEEQADLAEQNGQPWEENKKGKNIPPESFLGIGDTLKAYSVLQMFQEFLNLPPDTPEEERYDMILDIWAGYLDLSEAQKLVVGSDPSFAETFRQYGLWEDEPETEFPDYGGDDYGDYGGDEPMYTAAELAEMIKDKEQEIKSCTLDVRQSELDLRQKQRIIDGKVVKSTMEGTVVSVGNLNGESDEDYFVKVANEAGLYAKGSMSELALEKLNVGDTITGMLTTNGTEFSAVIKEVSEYPDGSNDAYYYGQENTNASYYPFYALIEDTEGLEEGEAEIYLAGGSGGQDDAIYLDNYFIRSESDGRTYVYKKGDDGKLTKQYVKIGKKTGYSQEIKEGLSLEDMIAFPYGKNVKEGAKTKDVDMLQDAFM